MKNATRLLSSTGTIPLSLTDQFLYRGAVRGSCGSEAKIRGGLMNSGMKRVGSALLALALVGCAGSNIRSGEVPLGDGPVPVLGDPLAGYRVGPLDVLSISVFKEPDLTFNEMAVDTSGRFEMPLIGTVQAAGKMPSELSAEIKGRLGRYLVDPRVEQKVTVDGSVVDPGVFLLQGETTLTGAIALANGPSRVAKLSQVAIFRTVNGQRSAAVFDLRAIRNGQMADPRLVANDVVVVGFSGLSQGFQDFLQTVPLIAIFQPFR
jgi:polysaccharide export outer membrane protein